MAEYINIADMWDAYENSADDVDMAEQFERLPTMDIVHCGECKHYNYGDCIPMKFRARKEDWFCADGERERIKSQK